MATGNPLTMQVLDALARGDKIGAIRLMREAGAPSLRAALQAIETQAAKTPGAVKAEASAVVDKAQSRLLARERPPTVAMGDPPGQLRWVLIVLALIAAAVWIAFDGRL